MSWTTTSLSADLAASDVKMTVASGSGFPAVGTAGAQNYRVKIDQEWMLADGQPVSGTITIKRRGDQGTIAADHDILSRVYVSNVASDWLSNPPASSTPTSVAQNLQATLGEDKTFTSAEVAAITKSTDFMIYKATAAAITLVAPSVQQNGVRLSFSSATAAAHVITATSLLEDGASGAPHTTATFAAYIGAGLTLMANNGVWQVMSNTGVTIT